MKIEFNSYEPIYIQIVDHVKRKILSGELKEGEKMPSVREYAGMLKVNPNTIQRVYSELEDNNLIYTQRGIGKFVTEDKEIIKNIRKEVSQELIEKFINDTKELGFDRDEIIDLIKKEYEN